MIERRSYLDRLWSLKDANLIKVITGIRRVGKSTLLSEFRKELKAAGEKHVLVYNLESAANRRFLKDPYALHDAIMSSIDPRVKNYVFIDEVQMIPEFERMVDSLFVEKNIDLYITGSNAYMSSSQLATLLSGRYAEVEVLPLSFSEYIRFFPSASDRLGLFSQYMRYGGFPEVANLLASHRDSEVPAYLKMIYDTIIEKDIYGWRHVNPSESLKNMTLFCFDNVGNITSSNSIANSLGVNRAEVVNYLDALESCFVLYRISRYDIRGKKLLQTLNKYYSVDVGLANVMLGKFEDADMGRRLENIIYLELCRRYSEVWIGKNYEKEIDFVVRTKDGQTEYFQVALSVANSDTREREFSAIKNTGDYFKKTIITLDLFSTNEDGIERVNAIDWLSANDL